MELPQPRPFGTGGRKSTHDFLSLYSPVPDPTPSQVGYLKTHDFLQPLEGSGKNNTKEENTVEIMSSAEPPPPASPPSGKYVLPGGIGTYSISHISYFNQRVLKPEGGIVTVAQASNTDLNDQENSNGSSYTGSGFTLWEESAVKKGKTGKENVAGDRHGTREAGVNTGVGGPWMTSEHPSQSSSNNNTTTTATTAAAATTTTNKHRNAIPAFSSRSSPQPPLSQKNQTFMDMLKSAKIAHNDDDDDEEEFILKKEPSPHLRTDLTVKAGGGAGKRDDQKPNTPRSKHSATEQRRRSKINDRFQMLRELIPHGDQKRDKASFLLEVIEYIQYLQEKVHKYEGSYEGWNQEPPKFTPWKKSHMPAEGFVDKSRTTNTGFGQPLTFAAKYEENNANGTSPTNPRNGQNAIECDMRNVTPLRANDRNSGLTIKAVPLLVPLQPNIFTPSGNSNTIPPIQARVAGDMENVISQPQPQLWQGRSRATNCAVVSNKLKEQEFTIESGKISISSVYSQGLLNTLTQALQSSGIDLSQASISVQIDLGKRANSTMTASTSPVKDIDIQPSNPTTACSRGASSGEKSEQALKRLRTN